MTPMDNKKKLRVVCRIEPGCLGPQGRRHLARFCAFAEDALVVKTPGNMHWQIRPRHDKHTPEVSYQLLDKVPSDAQVEAYLALFGQCRVQLETELAEWLSILVDQYFERS